MKERPILFSAPMVRAILNGTKTQTRRLVKNTGLYAIDASIHGDDVAKRELLNLATRCPYGSTGDRMWVRETHAIVPRTAYAVSDGVQQVTRTDDDHDAAIFKEGWTRSKSGFSWRPSIHMPRWACRITLEISNVRVERLQEISRCDAQAEGCHHDDPCDHTRRSCSEIDCEGPDYRVGFKNLWQTINGPESWSANPWVWVVEFKVVPR